MAEKSKPALAQRVEQLTVKREHGKVMLATAGISAQFYEKHFAALEKHFPDLLGDARKFARHEEIIRTNQGHHQLLFKRSLTNICQAYERGKAPFIRHLAVGILTWLKYYLSPDEVMDTSVDYFFNMDDAELAAEKTHRAKQMVLWQLYCLKQYADRIQSTEVAQS